NVLDESVDAYHLVSSEATVSNNAYQRQVLDADFSSHLLRFWRTGVLGAAAELDHEVANLTATKLALRDYIDKRLETLRAAYESKSRGRRAQRPTFDEHIAELISQATESPSGGGTSLSAALSRSATSISAALSPSNAGANVPSYSVLPPLVNPLFPRPPHSHTPQQPAAAAGNNVNRPRNRPASAATAAPPPEPDSSEPVSGRAPHSTVSRDGTSGPSFPPPHTAAPHTGVYTSVSPPLPQSALSGVVAPAIPLHGQ
ncbi:hypothetical protein HK405_015368, partial [Cladochytrium tenue]